MTRTRSSLSSSENRKRGNLAAMAIAVVLSARILIGHSAQAQTETVLYSFKGAPADAGYPSAGVILDAAGDIYGSSWQGGSVNLGTVFGVSKHGEKVLRSFSGVDGEIPLAGLARDAAGNLYGANNWGTVFKIGP